MNDSEMDKLFEQALSGPRPRDAFRAQVLRDSTAALAKRPARRKHWQAAALVAAGILIAATSFVLGRASMSAAPVEKPKVAQQPIETPETVLVSADLVAWLKAARLFEKLGMEQRVNLAYNRASKLLPSRVHTAGGPSQRAFAAEAESCVELPTEPLSRDIQSILAQSFGD